MTNIEFNMLRNRLLALVVCICCLSVAAPGIKAEVIDGLYTGEDLSTFDDKVIRSSSDKTIRMETLWERDLTQGETKEDANENDHNLIVSGDKLYTYVETYTPKQQVLRPFDLQTGMSLTSIKKVFPVENFLNYQWTILSDDFGRLAIVGFNTNEGLNLPVELYIQVCDNDLNVIKSIETVYPNNTPCDHFKRAVEWLGLKGDLMTGDFSIKFGCWHYFGSDSAENRKYVPSVCEFVYSSEKDMPTINVIRYERDGMYSWEQRGDAPLGGKLTAGMLMSAELETGVELVQGYGTSLNHTSHSPIILYKNNGMTDSGIGSGVYPMMSQIAILPQSADSHCFGVYPFKVGDEQLLVLPTTFNEVDGTRFRIVRMKSPESFDDVEELWKFPDESKVFYPNSDIYDYVRPKILVMPTAGLRSLSATEVAESDHKDMPLETTFYAYMPGAYIGAYKVSLAENNTPSGLIDVVKGSEPYWQLRGRILEVETEGDVEVEVFSISGEKIIASTILGRGNMDLSGLQSGVYLLRAGVVAAKLVLR